MGRMTSLAAVFVLVCASLLANAQGVPGDAMAAKGRAFALLVCATCHIVSDDQQFAPVLREPAARFDAIANKPATTADSLRTFLTTTHTTFSVSSGMPNPQLADYQIDEVIRYILTLKTVH